MTAPLLKSYVAGRWYAAPDEGTPIADAVTGETVARVSSTGLDVAAMLDHARTVGGPALRELTFHQRAGLLKQLGLRLTADKDAFYALSRRTGATDRDSAVDVDGGFGTLLSYASKLRRELPDDTVAPTMVQLAREADASGDYRVADWRSRSRFASFCWTGLAQSGSPDRRRDGNPAAQRYAGAIPLRRNPRMHRRPNAAALREGAANQP